MRMAALQYALSAVCATVALGLDWYDGAMWFLCGWTASTGTALAMRDLFNAMGDE